MMEKLRKALVKLKMFGREVRVRIVDRLVPHKHSLHEGHNFAHLMYFGAVFIEGHGFYAAMGLVLLVIGVVSWLTDLET